MSIFMKRLVEKFRNTSVPDHFSDCHGTIQHLKFINAVANDAYPMALYMAVYMVWFSILERMNRLHYTVVYTALDGKIPFIEEFILPYYAWFFFVAIMMVLLYFKDRATYHRACAFLAIGMTVFLVVSTVWPNIQYLRPAQMPRDNVFTHMVSAIYRSDTPTNVCPSIHVYNSVAMILAAFCSRWRGFQKKSVRALITVQGVLIILSTMFVKQHSVFDVTMALLMALPCYLLTFRMGFTFVGNYTAKQEKRLQNSET